MPQSNYEFDFDVAIVGGGPAGLSAAVVLGRARRRVVLFDHGKPRNYAAQAVHCFLAQDGISPGKLREIGRDEAKLYGAQLFEAEVVAAAALPAVGKGCTAFQVQTADKQLIVRALLLTTGVVDMLPDIPGFRELYGRSVHHCPYCDGWEHRDKHLVAFGAKEPPVDLAASLKTWSQQVTACTNGLELDEKHRQRLDANGVASRCEKVTRLDGTEGKLSQVVFESGPSLSCDALFFDADQVQRSPLAAMLGCESDDALVKTKKKQLTCVEGVFVAGDADKDVQFAIVAAAEGAIAATAINTLLQKQDQRGQ
jgi:thioredoxin reductase